MRFKNLADMLSVQAANHPGKKYIDFNDQEHTYHDVNTGSNRYARLLLARGLNKGDRVALLLGNSPEFIYAYFAIMKAGGVCVPINVFLTEEEISYILNDCEAKFLITSNAFKNNVEGLRHDCQHLAEIFTFETPTFDAVCISAEAPHTSQSPVESSATAEDLAVLIYTSGTTGHPKGAMLTHGNLLSNADGCEVAFKPTEKDRFLLFLPMFHSYAFTTCVLLPTYLGASIIILESVMELKKKSFRDVLLFKRPTLMLGVPQVYSALTKAKMPKLFLWFLYPVRLHISGGAPLPVEILNNFNQKFGRNITEGYGLSEASPVVCVNPTDRPKPGTVGIPLHNVQCKIVNDDAVEVPQGEVGELIVKGPSVMKGYWNRPSGTDEAIKNGWLFTGDYAKIDEEGYISIVDRKKDLILVKGMNVYPREIEELLYKFPGVEAAAVIGIPDNEGDEIPVAYIKPIEGVILSEKDLRHYLKEHLANFKIPRKYVFDQEIPLNATGKVLKRVLREMVIGGR